jgi:plasmid maintenance system antidote protein VapI
VFSVTAQGFGGTAEFWLKLQMAHDLEVARRSYKPVAA